MNRKGFKIYWLAALALGIAILPETLQTDLRLSFLEVRNGEWWRMLSGHLTHLSWTHLLSNIVGLVILQQLFYQRFSSWRWIIDTVFIALATGFALIFFSKELQWYAGLSAVIIGLFYCYAIQQLNENKWLFLILIACLTLYIAAQQVYGEISSSFFGEFPVASRAHLFGAIAGIVLAITSKLLTRYCLKR